MNRLSLDQSIRRAGAAIRQVKTNANAVADLIEDTQISNLVLMKVIHKSTNSTEKPETLEDNPCAPE